MVYKIQCDFNKKDFEKILSKLGKYYRILIQQGAFYIALEKYSENDNAIIEMKKALKPAKDFYIYEINSENLQRETPFVIEWCKSAFISLDKQKYEIEQQESLKEKIAIIDKMEVELEKISKENQLKNSKDQERKEDISGE